jgi:CRP/FNR family transcriptional regulator
VDTLLTLRTVPLFNGLPDEDLKALAKTAAFKQFKTGDHVALESDNVRAFFLVISGRVKIYKSSTEGKEQTLYMFGPGEPFCLRTAFADESFPANAQAMEDSTILIIPSRDMERLAKSQPALLFNIVTILSRRLKDSMQLVESLALKEIPERLAAFILHTLDVSGRAEAHDLTLDITQRELSKILGATPETLSRVIKRLGEEGVVSVKGRSIRIHDREALQELAGSI